MRSRIDEGPAYPPEADGPIDDSVEEIIDQRDRAERQISDLKQQLREKETARRWHHERELEANKKLREERARADALAGELELMAEELGMVAVQALQQNHAYVEAAARDLAIDYSKGVPEVRSDALKAHRQAREEGE